MAMPNANDPLVVHQFVPGGDVICTATPGGQVATTIHLGPYARLGEAHDAIRDWCTAHALVIASPFWEVYDHWNDDSAKLRTDVFYLLK
jgi:effector-binding domain-containing protein